MPSLFLKERKGSMAFYNVCEICGSNLDPGERCDCNRKSEELRTKYETFVTIPKNQNDKQLVLNIK